MSISRKSAIDLSQPHLIPARIRSYVQERFDLLAIGNQEGIAEPAFTTQRDNTISYVEIDPDYQNGYTHAQIIEHALQEVGIDSPLWEETKKDNQKRKGLIALYDGREDWIEVRRGGIYLNGDRLPSIAKECFPFLFTYITDNNRRAFVALNDLFKSFYPELYDIIPHVSRRFKLPTKGVNVFPATRGFHEIRIDDVRACEYANFSGRALLFNHQLFDKEKTNEKLRPVFIVERFLTAEKLEAEIWTNHIHSQFMSFASSLENNTDEDGLKIYETELNEPKDWTFVDGMYNGKKMLNNLIHGVLHNLHSLPYEGEYPLGDAIVSAAMGGYTCPWWTDWTPLSGRDVYVFKVGEPSERKATEQLLQLYSHFPVDTIGKATFVFVPFNTDAKDAVELWEDGAIFKKALDYTLDIPKSLKHEFDKWQRLNRRRSYYTNFILEPVLCKQSWMLITGEAASGKSFIAMAIGMALSKKGKLYGDFRIRKQGGHKVLYITDSEMTEWHIDTRMKMLKRIYGKTPNFFVKRVTNFSLLNGETGEAELHEYIDDYATKGDSKPVEVVILDHLLKLSEAEGDQRKRWPEVRGVIERLTERGVSVILVHHEWGGKNMMGTRLILNDAPAIMHVEKRHIAEKDCIAAGISIKKNRSGKDQPEVQAVTLNMGSRPGWHVKGQEESVAEPLRYGKAEERRKMVEELRADGKSISEISEILGVSKSCVDKDLQITKRQRKQNSESKSESEEQE